jgi:ribonucleoside-triphosphate reductase
LTQNNNNLPIGTPSLPKVRTSDDFLVDWDRNAIASELIKDYEFAKKFYPEINFNESIAIAIAKKVETQIKKLEEDVISSDTVRGIVTTILRKDGYPELASAASRVGIPAREFHNIITGGKDHDNANLSATPETSHKIVADLTSKNYYLKMLPEKLANAHSDGSIHIHDLEYLGTRIFCKSHDLRYFLKYGFSLDGDGTHSTTAFAPKHAHVAILQATKALAMGQVDSAGGQGLLHGTVFLAPYMKDKGYLEIKQLMQMMLYELNQMYVSRGGQTIFSSINLNPGVPKILEDAPAVYAGLVHDGVEAPKETYGMFEREVRLMFQALMELALEGDYHGRMFPFPKMEVAIERKFIDESSWETPLKLQTAVMDSYLWNDDLGEEIIKESYIDEIIPSYKELYEMAFKVVAANGTLYFDNMIARENPEVPSMSCTQCCSYQFADSSDTDDTFYDRLNFVNGAHFDLGGMQAGSINLPRHAYLADHDDKKLIASLFDSMDTLVELFKIKRSMIEGNANRLKFLLQQTPIKNSENLAPPYMDFNNLVYEIGIVGLNEMVQYHNEHQLHQGQDAIDFGKKVMSEMRKYCDILSQMHGMKIVLARTPAETTASRFAVADLLKFQDKAITTVKGDLEYALNHLKETRNLPIYYSNGFAPSVDAPIDIITRLKIENEFWPLVDGGSITHIWLGEQDPNPSAIMDFAMKVFRETSIGYIAFTKDLSQCNKCQKMLNGIQTKCSCGSDNLTVYSRITGYYSVAGIVRDGIFIPKWNSGKSEELIHRKHTEI